MDGAVRVAASFVLASSAVWLAGATANERASGSAHGPDRVAVRVLQFNLCDSGIAGCFTGRSVRRAAGVIRDERPDVVTLNEVCRGDVSVLARAMSAAHRGMPVTPAFRAAVDRRTGVAFRCVNGQQYGIGLLTLGPAVAGHRNFTGVYPRQDLADPEERVWLCVDVPARFYACTTHTASTSTAIALAQCRYFLNSVVPMLPSGTRELPVVLGADLNLRTDHPPGPQSCLPAGYDRADDGSRQDVVVSPGVAVQSRDVIDMRGTTDHPGLLVDLDLVGRA